MRCVCQLDTRFSSCLSSRPGSASPGTLAQRHCLLDTRFSSCLSSRPGSASLYFLSFA